jgi:hypothetical protein
MVIAGVYERFLPGRCRCAGDCGPRDPRWVLKPLTATERLRLDWLQAECAHSAGQDRERRRVFQEPYRLAGWRLKPRRLPGAPDWLLEAGVDAEIRADDSVWPVLA